MSIFFFGDSILAAQGVSPHLGCVHLFSEQTDELVQNASHNGDTTRIALERMHYDVLSHCPDVVVIQFGLNDCNRWDSDNGLRRVGPEAFRANLRQIVARVRAASATPVLLTNHCPQNPEHRAEIVFYNSLIRSIYELTIDIEAACEAACPDSNPFTLIDGIHLNAMGHEFYAEQLARLL